MTVSRPVFVLAMAAAVVGGVRLADQGPIHAQEGAKPAAARPVHIADAMLLPLRLPFAQATSLADVAAYLRKELKASVVLDLAALDRKELNPTDTVTLDLTDVRLKTGLKLLLDQVGLTTKVIAEDNLLIITDKAEAEEPMVRVLDEIQALHRDLHRLQDDIREVRILIETPIEEEEPIAKMRNPTIIEEKPADGDPPKPDAAKKARDKPSRTRPGI